MSTVLSYADMASKTSNANPLSLKQQKELEFPIRISHQNIIVNKLMPNQIIKKLFHLMEMK